MIILGKAKKVKQEEARDLAGASYRRPQYGGSDKTRRV
jgi:hypothetical protein